MFELIFFQDEKRVPALEFLNEIPKVAQAKAAVRFERLAELGNRLRRPEADFLRDGIYELRWESQGIQYRVLYFFHGKGIVVASHGFTKNKQKVPPSEIDLALRRRKLFESAPQKHSYFRTIGRS